MGQRWQNMPTMEPTANVSLTAACYLGLNKYLRRNRRKQDREFVSSALHGNLVNSAHFKVGPLQTRPLQTIGLFEIVGLNKV